MSVHSIHHVTLAVPDVERAEAAYCDVFDLDVLFREGTYDGEFGAVPDCFDWQAAEAAGVEWELNASDPPPATPFDELDVERD